MDQTAHDPSAQLSSLIDLAAERLGGRAILASDEFFAPKENLLKSGRGVYIEDKYTDHGKWMDGWETRRRRDVFPGAGGHDWVIIQLGLPGMLRSVTVDTNHFRGNHPVACALDAAECKDRSQKSEVRGQKSDCPVQDGDSRNSLTS